MMRRWDRVAWLWGVLVAVVSVAGCDAAASSPVVVRIGGSYSLTKAALDRWTAIEAVVVYEAYPRRRVPKGVIPDPPRYTSCIAFLRATAAKPPAGQPAPSTSQLRSQCREKRSVLQRQMLEILITSHWFTVEAASKGIRVTYAEAKRVMDEKFHTRRALAKFLALTGERETDEEFLLKRTMLSNRIMKALEKPGSSGAEQQQALATFAQALVRKWTARTDCRAGYVVSQCRQFPAAKA